MRGRATPSSPLTALLAGMLLLGCAGAATPEAAAAEAVVAEAARPALTQGKLDLNSASLEQLLALPIDESVARSIHDYRTYVRFFGDLYDLNDVDGVTPEVIAALKPLVAVLPPPEPDAAVARMTASYRQVRNYLSQEGSNEGLVDEYLDLLQDPVNINEMDIFELMSFQNVSPVDATNIVKARERMGGITSGRQLRRSEGLRYYAYRNLRDYVVYAPDPAADDRVRADYQLRYYDTPIYGGDDDNESFIRFRNVQLYNPAMSHKLRVDLPQGFRAGARSFRGLTENQWDETMKLFVEVKNKHFGGIRIKRAVVGTFRAAFGLGLVMDNTDFIHFRKTGYGWNKRPLGIRGDLSRTHEYQLTGAAVDASVGRFHVALFASSDQRAGILNPDGTVNRYVVMNPRPSDEWLDRWRLETETGLYREAFREELYGGNLKFMLAPGTYLGATVLQSNYDRAFDSRPSTLIEGGDNSEFWQARDSEIAAGYTSVFVDADSNTRTEYKWRRIYGLEGQAVVGNVAFQGEYGRLQDPRQGFLQGHGPDAFIFNTFAQWNNLHILVTYRDYDIDYDNPYQRSFSNDGKYEQTILDSSYRLEDPLYGWLSTDTPQAKGEKGMFIDMRYRISRQITISGLQFDQWERKADGADMQRYTVKLEYQPKFNLRFRLRHRVSSRTEMNPQDVRTFRSWENRLQMITMLSHYNRLQLTYMTGNVNFPARQRLSYPDEPGSRRSGVGVAGLPGYAIEGRYEHNLTPWLRLTFAASIYDGFFWNFEGNEFVLLDSEGWRQWFKIESRISERMLWQLKVTKDHKRPSTYVDNRDYGDDLPPTPDVTWAPRDDLYVRLQIDYSF